MENEQEVIVFSACKVPSELFDLLKTDLELPAHMFEETEKMIFNSPFGFFERIDAQLFIQNTLLHQMDIVLLFDISNKTISIYRCDTRFHRETIYISKFLKIYSLLFDKEQISSDKITIKDLRIPEETFSFKEKVSLEAQITGKKYGSSSTLN